MMLRGRRHLLANTESPPPVPLKLNKQTVCRGNIILVRAFNIVFRKLGNVKTRLNFFFYPNNILKASLTGKGDPSFSTWTKNWIPSL